MKVLRTSERKTYKKTRPYHHGVSWEISKIASNPFIETSSQTFGLKNPPQDARPQLTTESTGLENLSLC